MHVVFITGTRENRVAFMMRDAIWAAMVSADRVYHGACKTGVDALAASIALYDLEVEVTAIPARGKRDGWPKAGPMRNARLAERAAKYIADGHAVVCHAFPWGRSPGTRGCIEEMRKRGVPVIVHELEREGA